MKKISFVILSLLMLSGCKNDSKQVSKEPQKTESPRKDRLVVKAADIDWSGTWKYIKKAPGAEVPEEMLTIKMVQNRNLIKAQYCAITRSGGKIDCENDPVNNITGTLKNGKITAEFFSFFGSPKNKGKVEITANNDGTLTWKVKQFPEGLFYGPSECILTKEEERKTAAKKETAATLQQQWKGEYSLSIDYGKLDEFSEMERDYNLTITKDSCMFSGLGYKTYFTDVCSITGNQNQIIVKYIQQIEGDQMSNHAPVDTLAVVFRKNGKYYLKSEIVANKDWQYNIPLQIRKKS
ncbi:DUF5991 domain-containing protein [Chryseobacterium lactis]|uniref:DUF5991 domain-containing protein n=1 Tax=Chryseobacterium lactis TaxID=1241981 RepID=UPI0016240185|nr:DUF5991 domain-containing protein [Chryseobacterium lactis]